jgi:hypothetical protein
MSPFVGNATAAGAIQLGKNGSSSRLKRRFSHFIFPARISASREVFVLCVRVGSPHGKIAFGGEPAVPGADARRRLDAPVRAHP